MIRTGAKSLPGRLDRRIHKEHSVLLVRQDTSRRSSSERGHRAPTPAAPPSSTPGSPYRRRKSWRRASRPHAPAAGTPQRRSRLRRPLRVSLLSSRGRSSESIEFPKRFCCLWVEREVSRREKGRGGVVVMRRGFLGRVVSGRGGVLRLRSGVVRRWIVDSGGSVERSRRVGGARSVRRGRGERSLMRRRLEVRRRRRGYVVGSS